MELLKDAKEALQKVLKLDKTNATALFRMGKVSQSCVHVEYVCTSMQTQLASTLSYRCALDKEITRKLSSTSSWLLQRNPMKR